MSNKKQEAGPDLETIARRAMVEAKFVIEPPADARAELARLDHSAQPEDNPQVRDLRHLLWISIDNPESRDLDQVSFAEKLPEDATRVLVGIADVDTWVPQGSALDRFAGTNTTSVYTGVTVFPMLPELLSTDLSSFNEGQDRLAIVTELVVTADGSVRDAVVYRALLRNVARLDYDAIGAWLEGSAPPAEIAQRPELQEQLQLQDQAMSNLRVRRSHDGLLDFETIEPRPIVVGGNVVDLVVVQKNRARALIEQMMISTNSAVASFLEASGAPSIARELLPPARWDRIVAIAARHGAKLSAVPDTRSLATFLDDQRRRAPEEFADLSLAIVKLLGRSRYHAIPPGGDDAGHFGLAVEDYTHATAPNRRYPDLIVQRLLKAAIAGRRPPYSFDELDAIAERCTDRMSAANGVERLMRKATAIVLLAGREGQMFDGIVTGVTSHGTFARLLAPPAEGRVTSGDAGLAVGDRIRLRLVSTNLEQGWIDFARVDGSAR